MANTFYNRIIRKLVVGFGDMFSNITLVRYNPDLSEAERFIVPINYADKEKYVQRLQGDPDLEKKVQVTLPQFSYEMTGFTYDSTRKQNTNVRTFTQTPNGVNSQYNPVPYNFDFNLYLYTRNIEDAHQVLEHILAYFTPDYTIKLNLIPEMGIIKEVPIILNSTTSDIEAEGPRDSDTRLIIWTLNFTVKAFIFGPVSTAGLIKTSITNIYNDITSQDVVEFSMTSGNGTYQIGEYVYQGYSLDTATASAKVIFWTNNVLQLTEINGNFVSSLPIIGTKTNSNYSFTSYNLVPQKYANITVTPNPITANANNYTYNTTITEY